LLEDGVDLPAIRRRLGDVGAGDDDAALIGRLEPGNDPQRRRLAAARRAQQRIELARFDLQGNVIDGGDIPERLGYVFENEVGGSLVTHGDSLCATSAIH
jgi:hypothetical protein